MLEFDVWENQRLAVKEQLYRHDNRLNGDRPAWSSRDGKIGLHREAFLLPDDTWEWDGPWTITDLNGKPIEDKIIEKHTSSPEKTTTGDSSSSSGNSKGWFYAPSYLVSTKHCGSEPNALSLVRRRRWVRRAKKTIAGIVLPHPVTTIHYGYSCNPEAVALCSQNPMMFPLPTAAPTTLAGKASAFFKNPFSSSSSSSKNKNTSSTNNNSSSVSTTNLHAGTNNTTISVDTKNLSPQAIGEAALLLKHQSTFDTMQSFTAELFLRAKTAESIASSIPPEIMKILKESGIPQTLRAPIWMGFSGALRRKTKNRGKYQQLVEASRHKQRNPNSSINLDVQRTCSSHAYFANGTGPGAKSLRNVLFAYQEYALEKLKSTNSNNNNAEDAAVDLMAMMEKIEKKDGSGSKKMTTVADEDEELQDAFESSPNMNRNHHNNISSTMQDENDDSNNNNNNNYQNEHHDEQHQVYHQPLSYIASVFIMNCQDEEDSFWLLTVMAEECSLLRIALQQEEEQHQQQAHLSSDNFNNDNNVGSAAAFVDSAATKTMHEIAEKFSRDLKNKALPVLQGAISTVDFTMCAYSFFQALLTAHTSAPVSSRMFDIFLVNVRDSMVFVDFAVALCLKCFLEDGGVAFERSTQENGGRADTVSVSKFLNEQMRRISCDIQL